MCIQPRSKQISQLNVITTSSTWQKVDYFEDFPNLLSANPTKWPNTLKQ